MPPRFRRLISFDNPYLPFFTALVEQTEDSMQSDFRQQNPRRYLNYIYWILVHEPKFQCTYCSKVFRNVKSMRMHEEKTDYPDKQVCTQYSGRYVMLPPFSTLSFDAVTFMCNFGCSIVTDNKHEIIAHLAGEHTIEQLKGWCMNVDLMNYSLTQYTKSKETSSSSSRGRNTASKTTTDGA